MLPSSDQVYKAVVSLTAVAASYMVYIHAPNTYASDGRSGVALLILIAVSIVAMVALFGFLTLQVQSELEEEKKGHAGKIAELDSAAESKKQS